jgi:FdhD protein
MGRSRDLARLAFHGGSGSRGRRRLPEETAIALSYNGATQAVMMATPADLEDFAIGFTLTDGIARPEEIESVTPAPTERGIDLQIWLHPEAGGRLAARRRTMAGPVGCGLCGIDSLEEAVRAPQPVGHGGFSMTPRDIIEAVESLPAHQPLQDATHAVHAAAFWRPGAGIVALREDVGRHNALDKLAGALARAGEPPVGALVITSRVSIDMVQKCCAIGAPVLIAVSAPTAAAVEMARAAGLTLVALARAGRFEAFATIHRIQAEETVHVA